MTDRDPAPELPKCPRCDQRDRVGELGERLEADPHARYFCERCVLPFSGSQLERFEYQAKVAAREAERGLRHSSADAGRAAGVIGDEL